MRDAIASELAPGGVVDETRTLTSRLEDANTRKKLKAVKVARDVYRVAKSFVATDLGNAVKPHVDEMKRALGKPPKRTKASAKPPASTPPATPKPSDSTSQQK